MFDFKKVPIPGYSRREDTVNSVSHALGVPLSIAVLVMSLMKVGSSATSLEITAIIVYAVSMFILYFGSAFYHGLRPGLVKQVARVLDHSNIFLLISGTLTVFYVFGMLQYNKKAALILLVVSWVLALLGILLTFMDQEKFKKIQMVMYLALGWAAVIGMNSIYKSGADGKSFVILVLVGGLSYTVGAVFYGIGKKYPYVHAVFHIFILAGSVLQFIGLYRYML